MNYSNRFRKLYIHHKKAFTTKMHAHIVSKKTRFFAKSSNSIFTRLSVVYLLVLHFDCSLLPIGNVEIDMG